MKGKTIFIFSPINIFAGEAGNQQDIRGRIELFNEMGFRTYLFQFVNKKDEASCRSKPDNIRKYNLMRLRDGRKGFYRVPGLFDEYRNPIIESEISKENPDILWFEYSLFSRLASHLKRKFPRSSVYFRSHNFEIGHFMEQWVFNRKRNKRYVKLKSLLSELFYLGWNEALMFKASRNVFSISRLDIRKYRSVFLGWSNKLVYLPFYREPNLIYQAKRRRELHCVYIGGPLDYGPNQEGLYQIERRILPLLKKRNIHLHILGWNMSNRFIKQMSDSKRITFEGYVEDLERFLRKMDFAIIPISIGYGMKIKIHTMLSNGFPIIITKRNHLVFGGRDGHTYLVADTQLEWEKALKFIENFENRVKLSKGGFEFIKREFNKDTIMDTLSSFIS